MCVVWTMCVFYDCCATYGSAHDHISQSPSVAMGSGEAAAAGMTAKRVLRRLPAALPSGVRRSGASRGSTDTSPALPSSSSLLQTPSKSIKPLERFLSVLPRFLHGVSVFPKIWNALRARVQSSCGLRSLSLIQPRANPSGKSVRRLSKVQELLSLELRRYR